MTKRFKNHFKEVFSGISEDDQQLTQDEVVDKLNDYYEKT